MMKCAKLKKLEIATAEKLKRRAVKNKVTRSDEGQHAVIASL